MDLVNFTNVSEVKRKVESKMFKVQLPKVVVVVQNLL